MRNLHDPNEQAELAGHQGPVTALTALPDGRFVSGAKDGTIRLWSDHCGIEIFRALGSRRDV
ncbi:hypothetical protein [Acidicapsa acidisoli]|uniref:hypothetical protein n=1 Tax=Acidicapsa acidisoli TaxID=1615681 RepID=UPI0037C058D5